MPSLNTGESPRMRVRIKSTGQIGTIRADKFNPSAFEQLESKDVEIKPDGKFEFKDLIPVGGAILGGIVGGAPGAALGAGAGSLVRSGLNRFEGDEISAGGALKQAAIEGGLTFAGGKALSFAAPFVKPFLKAGAGKTAGAVKSIAGGARHPLRTTGRGAATLSEIVGGPTAAKERVITSFTDPETAVRMAQRGGAPERELSETAKNLALSAKKKLDTDFQALRSAALKERPKAKVNLAFVRKGILEELKLIPASGLPPQEVKGIVKGAASLIPRKSSLRGEEALKLRKSLDLIFTKAKPRPDYQRIVQRARKDLDGEIGKAFQGTRLKEADELYSQNIDDVRRVMKDFVEKVPGKKGEFRLSERAQSMIQRLVPSNRDRTSVDEANQYVGDMIKRLARFSQTAGDDSLLRKVNAYIASAGSRERIKGIAQPFISSGQVAGKLSLKTARGLGRLSQLRREGVEAFRAKRGIDLKNAVRRPRMSDIKLTPFQEFKDAVSLRISDEEARKLFQSFNEFVRREGLEPLEKAENFVLWSQKHLPKKFI